MKIKHTISILFMILLLASCKNGLTIFDQIDQETKLEDAVITGSVNSIVQSGDKLYASDGNIYSKDVNAVRGWSKIAGPGGTIIKLAADSNGVYALTSDKDLYCFPNSTSQWNKIDTTGKGTIETIFCDGLEYAFMKAGGKIYQLNNTQVGSECSNLSSITVFCSDGTNLYYADGGTVYVTAANSLTNNSLIQPSSDQGSVSGLGTIYSLTYSVADKAIYAGTNTGLRRLPLSDTGHALKGENQTPPGNWGATISNSQAFAVLATGDAPENAALYTSTIKEGAAYAKINGLWGYYYNRRSKWNRE
ncbi:MAG: hypothetical protein J6V63_03750 [Spirochaetaceae bacterium]|nr:hypothetical protein [Spirochaetaceae bacterium]